MDFLTGIFDCFFDVIDQLLASDFFVPLCGCALFAGVITLILYLLRSERT